MIQIPWTYKPPYGVKLNRQHPLAQGLVGCWIMNEGGGDTLFDLAGVMGNVTAVGSANWGGGAITPEVATQFSGVSDVISGSDDFTIIISENLSDNSSIYATWFAWGAYAPQIFHTGSNALRVFGAGMPGSALSLDGTLLLNTDNTVAIVKANNSMTGFINGNQQVTQDATSLNIVSSDFRIGWSGSTIEIFDGKIPFIFLYDRGLSKSEIIALDANPYQIFEPLFIPSVAGSSSILPIKLTPAIVNLTSTTGIKADILRRVNVGISDLTSTTDIKQIALRNLLVDLENSTSTTDITASISGLIKLAAAIINSTSTADISETMVKSVVANVTNTTSTTDIEIAIAGLIKLVAAIINTTSTSQISVHQVRRLSSAVINLTSTTDIAVILSTLKALTAAITNTTSTTDVDPYFKRSLIADVLNTSSTSDIAVMKGIYLSPAILNETSTADIRQSILRLLAAHIQNSTLTSDDILVILYSLSICGSDSLSVSITQDLLSCTVEQDTTSVIII